MKFAHPLWPKPLLENKFKRKVSVSVSILNTLLDYAYSTALIHKFGHTITLYATKEGAKMLDFIPYDRVVIINIPETDSIHFAAQSKFHALKKMELDEILIDGDVFIETENIYNEIDQKNDCDMLYGFDESNKDIQENIAKVNLEYFDKLLSKFHDTLYPIPTPGTIAYPNSCLMKFNNQDLKDKHINQYFYHKELLKDVDWDYTWPDIILEQYFLMFAAQGYTIEPLFEDYLHLNNDHKGFVHLGSSKTTFQNQVRQKLYFLDRDLFMKTMKRYNELTNKL